MAVKVGTAYVEIQPDFSGFNKATEAQTASVTGRFSSIGKAALVGLAASGVVGGLTELGKTAVDTAEKTEGALDRTNGLFGQAGKVVEQFAATSAKSYGISREAALQYAGSFGNLFRAMGDSESQAAKQSVAFTKLAADLAAFNHVPIQQTFQALQAGIAGNTRALKPFGVEIDQSTIKQEALRLGLINSVKDGLTPQAKAMAASALIAKQTTDVHGAFARQTGTLAEQTEILKARFSDVTGELGQHLMPIVIAVLTTFSNLFDSSTSIGRVVAAIVAPVEAVVKQFLSLFNSSTALGAVFQQLVTPIATVIDTLTHSQTALYAAAAALAVVVAGFGALAITSAVAQGIQAVTSAVQFLQNPLATINLLLERNPFVAIVSVLAALAAGFVVAYRDSAQFRDAINSIVSTVERVAGNAWIAARNVGVSIVNGVISGVSTLYADLKAILESTLFRVLSTLSPFSPVEHGGEIYIGRPLGDGALKGWIFGSANLPNTISTSVRDAVEQARQTVQGLQSTFNSAWSELAGQALQAFDGVVAQHKTPTEQLISQGDAAEQAQQLADAVTSAQGALATAQAGGDPATILAAQHQLDDALWQQKRVALQAQADLERKNLDAENALKRQHFSDSLDALGKSLDTEGATQAQAHHRLMELLRSFGVDYTATGSALGDSFVTGLKESQSRAELAASKIADAAKSRLVVVPSGTPAAAAKGASSAAKAAGAAGASAAGDLGGFALSKFADQTDASSKKIGDKIAGVTDKVKAAASSLVASIAGPFQTVEHAIESAWPTIQKIAGDVVLAWAKIRTTAVAAWAIFGNIITSQARAVLDGLLHFAAAARDLFLGLANFVTGIFTGNWRKAWQGIQEIVSGVWTAIVGVLQFGWTTLENVFDAGIQVVWLAMQAAWAALEGLAESAIGALGAILLAGWHAIEAAASAAWDTIRDALQAIWLAIKAIATTEFDGLRSLIDDVWNTIKSTTAAIWSDISNAAREVWSAMKSAATSTWESIKTVITSPISAARDTINGVWDDLKKGATKAWDALKSGAGDFADSFKNTIVNAFSAVVGTVVGFINDIIGVLDDIPGVNISKISNPVKGRTPGAAQGAVLHHDHFAPGMEISQPMVVVGEEAPSHPEFVIPTNPAYRGRALGLFSQLGDKLGIPGMALGGILGNLASDAFNFVAHGVGDLVGKLPGVSSLPNWLKATGKEEIGDAASWMKHQVDSLLSGGGGKEGVLIRMVKEMNAVNARHMPYLYGGGHGGWGNGPFDCSGLVSDILHAGGLLGSPETTDGLKVYGDPGDGEYITIGVRGTTGMNAHTMMKIGDHYLESGGGHGAAWVGGWDGNFPIHRHPPGFAKGGVIDGLIANLTDPNNPAFAGWGLAKGGTLPYVGAYKTGGIVPQDGMAYVHKDERILPAGADPDIHFDVTVKVGETDLSDIVDVQIQRRDRDTQRKALAGVR